jgi:hypothetical protein
MHLLLQQQPGILRQRRVPANCEDKIMITTAAVITQLLLMVYPGLVLHRALALRFLSPEAKPSSLSEAKPSSSVIDEVDLLAYGLLPGLAIVNTIGTVLAGLGVFRTWVYVTIIIAALVWRRGDAVATVGAMAQVVSKFGQCLGRRNLLVIGAIGLFLQTAFGLILEAQYVSANVDVWNHNFPLAQSIVSHHGFVTPLIDNLFYGTYPIFFHMFFAEGLLFVDHVIVAKVANMLIYLAFLISLIPFSQKARSLAVIVLFTLIVDSPFFSAGAADAMTDAPRVCYTVMALAFTYRYLRDGHLYFILVAGMLAGGAVAGKYSELPTPFLVGLGLLPAMITMKRRAWIASGVFALAFLPVAAYPYVRNLVHFANPIYPFIFGHPGLSEAYMVDLRKAVFFEIADPSFRSFSQDLSTWQGWVDFYRAVQEVFLSRFWHPYLLLGLIAIASVFRRSRIAYLALCTFIMLALWHTVGGINFRWGLGAGLVLLTTSYLSFTWLTDKIIEVSTTKWQPPHPLAPISEIAASFPPWFSAIALVRLAFAVFTINWLIAAGQLVRADGWAGLLPVWADKEGSTAVLKGPSAYDAFLSKTREGYEIYRYIGDHDLKMVWQPFDNGAWYYQSAYNGRTGNWILPWHVMPDSETELGRFLCDKKIRYVVFREVQDYTAERLGYKHVEYSYQLIRPLIAKSRRLLVDPFGWELYEIDPASVP